MKREKSCIICGLKLPATDEYFVSSKSRKDGLRNECRNCVGKKNKQWYVKNKEKALQYHKNYYKKNQDRLVQEARTYRKENKAKCAETAKKYRFKNKESIKIHLAEYREKNYHKVRATEKAYRKANEEKYRILGQKRKSLKKNLPSTLTKKQWDKIKKDFGNKCAYCGKEHTLSMEHFIPLSKFGELTPNNIIPACQYCNSSKKDKDFYEWYPRYKHYSKKREAFILDYLGYKNDAQQLKII